MGKNSSVNRKSKNTSSPRDQKKGAPEKAALDQHDIEVPGYRFCDKSYLKEALSHPSLNAGRSYQRLEFLGDRVLGLVIAEALFNRYPEEAEGRLNRRYSALVRREALAEISLTLKLDEMILMTEGADIEGTRQKPSVLGDIGEAVIGAIYLDGGFDAAKTYILKHWQNYLSGKVGAAKDSKTALQEWAQGRGFSLPTYTLVRRFGPDHLPEFQIAVSVEESGTAEATARSKRMAEQLAAQKLLEILESKYG